jgi:hypothetical protein
VPQFSTILLLQPAMTAFFPRVASRAICSAARPVLHVQRPAAASFRRRLAIPAEQPRLRLGSVAPDFEAQTTHGKIKFHEFLNGKWTILFSHPADFTPVCTTELGAFAKLKDEFDARGVQMLGLVSQRFSHPKSPRLIPHRVPTTSAPTTSGSTTSTR